MDKETVLQNLNNLQPINEGQEQALSIATKAIENLHVKTCVVCGEVFTTTSIRKYCTLKCKDKMRYNNYED